MFATDQSIGIGRARARASRSAGSTSLCLPEHTHIPTSRRTPPPTGDAELAEEYKRTLDPFVALGMRGRGHRASRRRHRHLPRRPARADRHRQGGRHARPPVGRPVRARRRLRLERGRGRAPRRRHADAPRRAREHVLAMRALWRERRRASSTASTSTSRRRGRGPSPRDAGRAAGAASAAPPGRSCSPHIAEYADGWIPIGGAGIREALPDAARARARRADRDPQTLRIVPFGTVPTPGKLEYYASLGVDEIVLRVPSAGRGPGAPACSTATPSSSADDASPRSSASTRPGSPEAWAAAGFTVGSTASSRSGQVARTSRRGREGASPGGRSAGVPDDHRCRRAADTRRRPDDAAVARPVAHPNGAIAHRPSRRVVARRCAHDRRVHRPRPRGATRARGRAARVSADLPARGRGDRRARRRRSSRPPARPGAILRHRVHRLRSRRVR